MSRKRWTPKTDITPELLRFRQKRKWQIALRRYIIDQLPSTFYAPYFGLDIRTLRAWLEIQFTEGASWENFGKTWQIEHYVPVTFFDYTKQEDLRLCWNFINLRVELLDSNTEGTQGKGLLGAKSFFQELWEKTNYPLSKQLLEKIRTIEEENKSETDKQASFIREHADHLRSLEKYTEFEFELLNKGRSVEDINHELEQMKKIKF